MTVSKMAPAQMAPTDAVVEASFTKFSQVKPYFLISFFFFKEQWQTWFVIYDLFFTGSCFWEWFWWLHWSHHLLSINWCSYPFPQPPIGRSRQQVQTLKYHYPLYFVMVTHWTDGCFCHWSNIDNQILEKNTNYLWWSNYWWLNQLLCFVTKKIK